MLYRVAWAIAILVLLLAAIAVLAWENSLVPALCGAGLAVLIGMYWLLYRALHPLHHLIEFTQEVAAGNMQAKIHANCTMELGALQQALQGMFTFLKEKMGLADAMLQNIVTPMVVVNEDGSIRWMNNSLLTLLEYDGSPEMHYGKSFSQFFYGESRTTVSELALRERQRKFSKTEVQSRKGNTRYISVASAPITDYDGRLIGGFTTIMDFTNTVLNERTIRSQTERMATAARTAASVMEELAAVSRQLNSQARDASEGARQQQDRTGETAAALEEMNATIVEVARSAANASLQAQSTEQTARDGAQLVQKMVVDMDGLHAKSATLADEMGRLGSQAEGIGQIMTVINDIADQTNLLALNAAIEAARAGDAGRGFAVVADEVRKLAEKTMLATKDVGQFIGQIQASARTSIQSTHRNAQIIAEVAAEAHAAGEALNAILSLVGDTAAQIRTIAAASEEQSASSDEITRASGEIATIASHVTGAMEAATARIEELDRLSRKLEDAIVNAADID